MVQAMTRVLVAMSGGVDSSVTAHLLREQGYDCVGCTMRLLPDFTPEGAVHEQAIAEARQAAANAGIPFYVADFRAEFQHLVVDQFVASYAQGLTPNPCIFCNKHLKFAALLQYARSLGCTHIATGHYARITAAEPHFQLRRAVDAHKDQSYVLYNLTPDQLAHTLLPLGEYTKEEVRALAERYGLQNAHKPDSQDICFVPDGDYAKVVEARLGHPAPAGDFVNAQGQKLGRHRGLIHYTVGQHRGLGLSLPQVHYVCRLNPARNEVVLGPSPDLFRTEMLVSDCNWTAGQAPQEQVHLQVKIRYRAPEQEAVLQALDDHQARVTFVAPQRAIAPGQSAVFYLGDTVVGGGIIQSQEQA